MADTDLHAYKMALRDRMLSLEAAELATAKEHYARFLKDARVSERESYDTSEIAEARENADLAAAFDHPVQSHHAKIDVLENLDFAVTDTVQPGAVVSFGDRHFVVAVSTGRFDHDGKTYMGISTDSPIYKAMEGLKTDEAFEFRGRNITIDEVI